MQHNETMGSSSDRYSSLLSHGLTVKIVYLFHRP